MRKQNFVITADGAFRGNKEIPLKSVIDDALTQCPLCEKSNRAEQNGNTHFHVEGRDVWWEDEIKKVEAAGNPDCPAEEMDAEDMLFILYTSGQYRQTERRGAYLRRIYGLCHLFFRERVPV